MQECGREVEIAGCIPPLGESFRADNKPTEEEGRGAYIPLVQALLPYVDSFYCETFATAFESLLCTTIVTEHSQGKPVYVSWTLKELPGAGLRSGESVTEAFNLVSHLDLAGYMINCCTPEAALAAI